MKKLIVVLAILTIGVLIFAGCSTPAPAPSSTSAPPSSSTSAPTSKPASASSSAAAPTSAPASKPASANTVTIKLGYDTPPTNFIGEPSEWMAKEIPKRTEGRVQVQTFPAGALAAMAKSLDYLRVGTVDMYVVSPMQFMNTFPLSVIESLPGLSFPATMEGRSAGYDVFMSCLSKYPAVANEWKEFKVITYYGKGPVHLITKDKEVHTPADLVGVKVGSQGLNLTLMQTIGAVPVQDLPPLAYEKLQTGVTQAAMSDWSGVSTFHLWEVAKNCVDVNLGGGGFTVIMSMNSWNKVSSGDQKILLDIGSEAYKVSAKNLMGTEVDGKQKFLAASGHTLISIKPDEQKKWEEKYAALWDKWVKDQEAAGLPAKAVLGEWEAASKKASGG